jgi:Ca2+-binding RTX toxin-like protein
VLGPRHTYDVPAGDDESLRPVGPIGGGPAIPGVEIGPIDYPDSYDSPTRFIDDRRFVRRDPAAPADPTKLEWYCFACSFRPWIDAGDAASAAVTIVDAFGVRTVTATRDGDRWITDYQLQPGETAYVEIGGVRDPYGNYNGARSEVVSLDGPPPPPPPPPPEDEPQSTPPPVPTPTVPGPQAPGGAGPGHCEAGPTGSAGADKLLGGEGSDLLRGLGGRDQLSGGPGDDCLHGGADRDRLHGGQGDDLLAGGRERDRVQAGQGDDVVHARHGRADLVDCGPGDDTVTVGRKDITRNCEHIVG